MGLGLLAVLTLFFGVILIDYTLAVFKQGELKRLRSENIRMKTHIQSIVQKTESLEKNLQKVEDFSIKLKSLARREETLAVGPLPYASSSDLFNQWPSEKHSLASTGEKSKKKNL